MSNNKIGNWNNAQEKEFSFFMKVDIDTLNNLQKEYIKINQNILTPLNQKHVALDLCCGPLTILNNFPNFKKRIALDSLLERYVSKFGKINNLSYIAAKAEQLPFKDKSFDTIFCLNALDHTENWRKVVQEMLRILCNTGMVYLDFEQTNYFEKFLMKLGWQKHLSEHHLATFSVKEIIEEMQKKSKIKIIQVKYKPSISIAKLKIFLNFIFLKSKLNKRSDWERQISATSLPLSRLYIYFFVQLYNFIGFILYPQSHAYFVQILIEKI